MRCYRFWEEREFFLRMGGVVTFLDKVLDVELIFAANVDVHVLIDQIGEADMFLKLGRTAVLLWCYYSKLLLSISIFFQKSYCIN